MTCMHDVHWSCIYSDVTEDASPYRNRTLHTFVEFLQHQRRGLWCLLILLMPTALPFEMQLCFLPYSVPLCPSVAQNIHCWSDITGLTCMWWVQTGGGGSYIIIYFRNNWQKDEQLSRQSAKPLTWEVVFCRVESEEMSSVFHTC